MIYECISKTTYSIDATGNVQILNTESTVDLISTETVIARFSLTESHKQYNYISLGKYSQIQLPKFMPITVVRGNELINVRTHKTQLNRIDRMKKILEYYNPGDIIEVIWDRNENTLKFS